MIRNVLITVSMFVFVGCAGTAIKPDEYRQVATGKADVMPSKAQLSATKSKIVLFDVNDKVKHASFSRMAIAMTGAIEMQLVNAGAEIVDRSLAVKLAEEINLVEAKGEGSYSGPAIAHFAIKPSIHAATIDSKFTKASSWTDKKGKVHHTPASCKHTSTVKGVLNLYEVPSLRLVKAINLVGQHSIKNEKHRFSRCPFGTGEAESLLIRGSEAAVGSGQFSLKNEITPSAYISERRRKGDEGEGEGIVVTTLGTDIGASQGKNVEIFRVSDEVNPLTGKSSTRKYKIGEGKISSQIGRDYSWVIIKTGFEKVRIGHQVKVIYKGCGLVQALARKC